MNLFVIGDVHGCYETFLKMLTHWDKEQEVLIQLGDLIDRGNKSPEVVKLARQLKRKYPYQAVFLKGNHEYEIIEHIVHPPNHNWLKQGGIETLDQYVQIGRDIKDDVNWFHTMPLFWENETVFVSHAGISRLSSNPFNEMDVSGILWNRGPLKNIQKLQVIGHTPHDSPIYEAKSNSWNIDTAAVFGNYLTGMKIKQNGEILEWVKVKTDKGDRKGL
ncbi:metallophosphoesterase family protein [Bacillus sp. FJAT-22090]|uniref:metallophosphoesterase family protein n=1 Tax=Bacillus sp. FJAT-22090 TaxID=1581038 RepID=UPI00119D208D|nr:metallophosphoesterase family protein [Bacillus sp. FJAT-22090]